MPVIVALVWLLFDNGVMARDVLDALLLDSRLQRVIRALSNRFSGNRPHYSLIELCCYGFGLCALGRLLGLTHLLAPVRRVRHLRFLVISATLPVRAI